MKPIIRIIQGVEFDFASKDVEIDSKVFAQAVAECDGCEETALQNICDGFQENNPDCEVIYFFR